ncbi:MAG: universal stress protein [Saprospiraceae bacterium]|nr:universal stress protein [Saprospiraceae bacterium]
MNFKNAITALDFSTMDDSVIRYIRYWNSLFQLEKVYFMHIIKDLSHPKSVELEFHKIFHPDSPLDEKLRHEMSQHVERLMPKTPDLETTYEVHEGSPVEKMLHWADVKNIDLVVFGRKKVSEGSGLTPRRMAHRLDTNILFVPEKTKEPIRRVVVPLDYSEHSLRALETALALQKRIPGLKIEGLHVIEMMPVDHYPANTAYQHYAKLMKEANEKAYLKMTEDKGIEEGTVEKVFVENTPHTVPKALNDHLRANPCDLVIIGAKGHSALRNFFFGSTTERFIDLYDESPVLIIR